MKKVSLLAFLSMFFLLPVLSVATDVDTADKVLISYKVTATDEANFSTTDRAISAFWRPLMENTNNKFDNITLTPEVNGIRGAYAESIGFQDGSDANQWVYAAWGEKGLYLLIETQDDHFVDHAEYFDPLGGGESSIPESIRNYWMGDCVEMFLDPHPTSDFPQLWVECVFNEVINSTWEYQYQYGSSEPPTVALINFPSPGGIDRWNPDCVPVGPKGGKDGKDYVELQLTPTAVSEAEVNYGIKIEVVNTDPGKKKAQEWFFPWNHVGAGMTIPSLGQKIGFSINYNDYDPDLSGTSSLPDVLFWIPYKNPLFAVAKTNEAVTSDHQVQNWGDIEFGDDIVNLVPVIRNASRVTVGRKVAEWYSIDGRKISQKSSLKKDFRVAVKRFDGNSSTITSIIR